MDLVISHASAEWYWRRHNGRLLNAQRERFPEVMARPVRLDAGLRRELAVLGMAATTEQPLDLLFWHDGFCSESRRVRTHVLYRPLPPGGLIRVSNHVLITSPEVTFAQLSRLRSFERLLLAGCELCGSYRLFSGDGRPLRMPEERQPLTSTAAIAKTLAAMGFGRESAAVRAARLTFDGARSPMEAKVALLLSLPPRFGGFGLPRPVLNAPLRLSRAAYTLYPCNPCRLDLYWEAAHLDVEYDGEDSHGPDDHAKDVARAAALALAGVDMLILTKAQVYDRRAFDLLAGHLARRLDASPRKRPDDFISRQIRLRRELELL